MKDNKIKFTKGTDVKFINADRLNQIATVKAAGFVEDSKPEPKSAHKKARDSE
jgi:hypothetical protein